MSLPEYWYFWGLGWFFLPRMTIGIAIYSFTPYNVLGIILAIIGAIIDLSGSSNKND